MAGREMKKVWKELTVKMDKSGPGTLTIEDYMQLVSTPAIAKQVAFYGVPREI